jgi:hypothetical protein
VVIANAVIRKLRAEQIEIGSLKVGQLEVAGRRWAEERTDESSQTDGSNGQQADPT